MWRGLWIVMLTASAVAAGEPVLSVTGEVESGWTSNAADSPLGGADLFVTQRHALILGVGDEAFALRGTLTLSQTRFQSLSFEDDAGLGVRVEAELALEAGRLRLGYALERSWTGDDLAIGPAFVAVRGSSMRQELGAELVLGDAAEALAATLAWTGLTQGETEFVGLGLAPVRLAADAGEVLARLVWQRGLAEGLALRLEGEGRAILVSEADRIAYARLPVDGLRLAAGLDAASGNLALAARAGAELVWPQGRPAEALAVPYADLALGAEPLPSLALKLRAGIGTELLEPVDGAAAQRAEAELRLAYAVAPALEVFAELAASSERGLFDPSLGRAARQAAVGLARQAGEHLGYRLTLARADHDEPGGDYARTTLSLALTGRL